MYDNVFVIAVAGITVFNSSYVLSMETCLFICRISSADLEMAAALGPSISWYAVLLKNYYRLDCNCDCDTATIYPSIMSPC